MPQIKLPVWIKKNSLYFYISFLFFVFSLILFQGDFQLSGSLLKSEILIATGSLNDSPLFIQISQIFLIIPVGSILFRLFLLNLFILSGIIFLFSRFVFIHTKSLISSSGASIALSITLFSFQYSYSFSTIPLTFLFILLILNISGKEFNFKYPRKILIIGFLTGLGTFGLHPIFRFMVPPLIIVWLLSYKRNIKLFKLIPIFFLFGFSILLFIPLSTHRGDNLHSYHQLLDHIFSIPNSKTHETIIANHHLFVWWENLKSILNIIFQKCPVFLIPIMIIGIFPFKFNRSNQNYYTFMGLGLTSLLFSFWLSPWTIKNDPILILILGSFWLASTSGIEFFRKKIPNEIAGHVFNLTFWGISILSVVLMNIPNNINFKHHYDKQESRDFLLFSNGSMFVQKTKNKNSVLNIPALESSIQNPNYLKHTNNTYNLDVKPSFKNISITSPWSYNNSSNMYSKKSSNYLPHELLDFFKNRLNTKFYAKNIISNDLYLWSRIFLKYKIYYWALRFVNYSIKIIPESNYFRLKAKILLALKMDLLSLININIAIKSDPLNLKNMVTKITVLISLYKNNYLPDSKKDHTYNTLKHLLIKCKLLNNNILIKSLEIETEIIFKHYKKAKKLLLLLKKEHPDNPKINILTKLLKRK